MTTDAALRALIERATSPIIMSHRIGDASPELALMGRVIARMYPRWGYDVPEPFRQAGS